MTQSRDAVYCYILGVYVCLEPAKTDGPLEMPLGGRLM